MIEDLDALLDECIDRINRGESLEGCLASYPEHAEELEPLLRTILDIRATSSPIPSLAAKAVAKQRFDAALAEMGRHPKHRVLAPLFRRPRAWAVAIILSLLAIVGGSLGALLPGGAPVVAQDNFCLLISDEANAISDFQSLEVTITSIGVHRGGESAGWQEIGLDPPVVVDLTRLQGLNAQEVWSGILTEGQYTKVFIYIDDDAIGMLKENGEQVEVMAPSDKLQISKPFAITADGIVNFVYDVTVVEAGQSGQYILLPQLDQCGANQKFHKVGAGELTLRVVAGDVIPGQEITVLVTLQGEPVVDAQVTVNDVYVGTTDVDGCVSFIVLPVEELEIKAASEGLEGELLLAC